MESGYTNVVHSSITGNVIVTVLVSDNKENEHTCTQYLYQVNTLKRSK